MLKRLPHLVPSGPQVDAVQITDAPMSASLAEVASPALIAASHVETYVHGPPGDLQQVNCVLRI